jgi:hypothetical protein
MGDAGTPYGRFQRALKTRNPLLAWMAATELGQMSVADALALTLLLAERDTGRFGGAAARWHARYLLEARGVEVEESQLLLASLAALPGEHGSTAAEVIASLVEKRGHRDVAAVARRWSIERPPTRRAT